MTLALGSRATSLTELPTTADDCRQRGQRPQEQREPERFAATGSPGQDQKELRQQERHRSNADAGHEVEHAAPGLSWRLFQLGEGNWLRAGFFAHQVGELLEHTLGPGAQLGRRRYLHLDVEVSPPAVIGEVGNALVA